MKIVNRKIMKIVKIMKIANRKIMKIGRNCSQNNPCASRKLHARCANVVACKVRECRGFSLSCLVVVSWTKRCQSWFFFVLSIFYFLGSFFWCWATWMNARTHRKFSEPECSNVFLMSVRLRWIFGCARAYPIFLHARAHTHAHTLNSRTLITHITQETEQVECHITCFFLPCSRGFLSFVWLSLSRRKLSKIPCWAQVRPFFFNFFVCRKLSKLNSILDMLTDVLNITPK